MQIFSANSFSTYRYRFKLKVHFLAVNLHNHKFRRKLVGLSEQKSIKTNQLTANLGKKPRRTAT